MKKKIDLAKQPKSAVITTYVALMSLIVFRAVRMPRPVELSMGADMPLGRLIDSLCLSFPQASLIAGIALILLNAIILTRFIEKYYVTYSPTQLPMLMYMLCACGIFFPAGSLSFGVVSLLLVVSSIEMTASFKRTHTFGNVFKSALCLGIIPLIYSPGVVLAIMLPATLAVYGRDARESIVAFIAYVLPFLLAGTVWWIAGEEWLYLGREFINNIWPFGRENIYGLLSSAGIPALATAGIYAAFLLYSMIMVLLYLRKIRTRARKIYVHFTLLLIVSAAAFLLPSAGIISFGIFAVPASLISTAFFVRHKGRLSLVLYLVLVFSVAVINFLPLTTLF